MKINDKILSIPPYISTSWKNIVTVQLEERSYGHALVIELVTGTKVDIPNLDRPLVETIFLQHAKALEEDGKDKDIPSMTTTLPFSFALPHLEGIMPIVQHNEDQKDSPPLPAEMLEKIAEMTQGLLPVETTALSPTDPDCNCPHCQIMRAISSHKKEAILIEEDVSDEDLKFRTWDIKQENEKLYSVTNPLDIKEHYNVFLGDPLGCTCGSKSCEHIQAVLKS